MDVRSVRQGWVGRGYWVINLITWPFEAFPALLMLLLTTGILLSASAILSVPVVMALDLVFGHVADDAAYQVFGQGIMDMCPASAPMRQIEGAAFRRVLVSS